MTYASSKDNNEIIEGCLAGDKRAQKKLFDLYFKKIVGISIQYFNDYDTAIDVAQDTMIKMFHNLENFKKEQNFLTWLRRIAINTCIDRIRTSKKFKDSLDIDEVELSNNDFNSVHELQYKDLLNLLHQLPPACKVIFTLFAVDGYKHTEIAEMLNINEGTSKSQVTRARKLLQQLLSNQEKSIDND